MLKKTGKVLMLLAMFAVPGACDQDIAGSDANSNSASTADASVQAATPGRQPSGQGAVVTFVTPQDGAIVTSPVHVEFSISGMDLVPAGNNVANSGHHHVLVDTGLPDLDLPIPADANHVHFGDGSSSTELTLPRGEHTLQLLFADYLHIPHDAPVFSEPITITVD